MAPINYKGKSYKSIKELAKVLGIKRETLGYRIRQKWPEDDWDRDRVSGLSQSNEGIEFEGIRYESVSALADHLGLSKRCLHQRIKSQEPQEDWARPSRRGGPVEFEQIKYPTLYDLAKKVAKDNSLGAGGCFRKLKEALKRKMHLNKAVEYASQNRNNIELEYLGETFDSLTALSKHLDIHLVTLRERIIKGWPEEMWADEKLPTQSPDFYFAIENPARAKRQCSVYVTELRNFSGYQKIGIAVSPTHRRDAEYGEEHYASTFQNRLHALIFEGAIHSATQKHVSFPEKLAPPYREEAWHGITEVREIQWEELESIINMLQGELDEDGFEDLALRYIPMSKTQRKLLTQALNFLEYDKQGDVDT